MWPNGVRGWQTERQQAEECWARNTDAPFIHSTNEAADVFWLTFISVRRHETTFKLQH